MAPTLRLSDEGKRIVEQARIEKGWTKNSVPWTLKACELLEQQEGEKNPYVSTSTLQRFIKGVGITTKVFKALCGAVEVDWRKTIITNNAPESSGADFQLESQYPNLSRPDPYEGTPQVVHSFYGRVRELRQLQQWLEDRYRLVIVYGIGGIGKTQLVAKMLAEQAEKNEQRFSRLLWQNFSYTLPLEDLLADLVVRLSSNSNNLSRSREELISRLLTELHRERTLVILDEKNSDEESHFAERYSTGYKHYSTLLQRLSTENHQSCIVLTTREKPTDVTAIAGDSAKAFNLEGLDSEAGCKLLEAKSLVFDEQTGKDFIQRYRGNPLSLQLVASVIRDQFQGKVRDFLAGNSLLIPHSIDIILQQLIKRLSETERDVLCCLAGISTRVSLDALREYLPHISFSKLLMAINALERRSLLEKESEEHHYLYTLQPVVMKFVQQQLTGT